jgi:hypothetical protein
LSVTLVALFWILLVIYSLIQLIYIDHVNLKKFSDKFIMSQSQGKSDLLWIDGIYIEAAFRSVPRPCLVKLTPTNIYSRNSRNILAHIIRENSSCSIVDDEIDGRMEFAKDTDALPIMPIKGLIVRWDASYVGATKFYQMLTGNYCPVIQGHSMPVGSPINLIWITVGDDYPWSPGSKCQTPR